MPRFGDNPFVQPTPAPAAPAVADVGPRFGDNPVVEGPPAPAQAPPDLLEAVRGPAPTDPNELLGIGDVPVPVADPAAFRVGGALTAGAVGLPVAAATGPLAPATELGIVALGSEIGAQMANLWNEYVAGVPDERSTGERLLEAGRGIANEAAWGAAGGAAAKPLAQAAQASSQFLKRVVGGGTAETEAALKAFKNAGVDPSLGMVAGRTAQGTERALEKLPLSSGIMQRNTDRVRRQLMEANERLMRQSGRPVSEMATAGEGIQRGVRTGIEAAKRRFEDAYRFVPGLSRLNVDIGAVRELAEDVIAQEMKGLGDEAALKVANRILARKGGVDRGLSIPFDEAVKLRSDLLNLGRTGEAEVAGAAESAAQRLAGQLDEAMETAAGRGVRERRLTDEAFKEWRSINRQYAEFQDQLAQVRSIAHAETPELAFKLTIAGAGDGPSRMNAVKEMVPPEAWDDFVTYQLGRMGLETPGMGSSGELYFSPQRWLTNVRAIKSEESRALLFGPKGSPLRKAVDDLTEVAGRLREGKFLANPSGTAGQSQFMNLISGANVGTAPMAFMLGHPVIGGTQVAAQFGGAPAMAKLFTWPGFVEWYAKAARIKPTNLEGMAAHMALLPRLAERFPEYRDALLAYVDGVDLLLEPKAKPGQKRKEPPQ